MPINYFEINCKSVSNKQQFGLCDAPPPASNPAYIDESDSTKWIGIVNNPSAEIVHFYAIDNCIKILKVNNQMDSRCDGVISHGRNLVFVELKNRAGGQWLKEGREQLTATIKRFKTECDISKFEKVEGYVCNSLRPLAHSGQACNIQMFKNDTGFTLRAQQHIDL